MPFPYIVPQPTLFGNSCGVFLFLVRLPVDSGLPAEYNKDRKGAVANL